MMFDRGWLAQLMTPFQRWGDSRCLVPFPSFPYYLLLPRANLEEGKNESVKWSKMRKKANKRRGKRKEERAIEKKSLFFLLSSSFFFFFLVLSLLSWSFLRSGRKILVRSRLGANNASGAGSEWPGLAWRLGELGEQTSRQAGSKQAGRQASKQASSAAVFGLARAFERRAACVFFGGLIAWVFFAQVGGPGQTTAVSAELNLACSCYFDDVSLLRRRQSILPQFPGREGREEKGREPPPSPSLS